ncbi:hypothetical protein SEUCBS139899_009255 [Sporothrix eucalyptigena]
MVTNNSDSEDKHKLRNTQLDITPVPPHDDNTKKVPPVIEVEGNNSDNNEAINSNNSSASGNLHILESKHNVGDQTNLLPMRQLLVVFAGLSVAMLCSMLNQTIVLSGVAVDLIMLIVVRAVAGIGGGGIVTTVTIVVSDVVSLQDRGKYQGIIGVVVAVATAIGPLVGGLFTEKVSWRWCFYISIPLSGVAMIIVAFVLPFKQVEGNTWEKIRKIDGWGSLVSFAASVAILLPISWGGSQYPWKSVAVILPLCLGAAFIGIFLFIEAKVARLPLIPLHIFKNKHISACIFCSFLTGFMTFVNLYYLPQFYQVVRGDSALEAGILILPLILSQIITSFSSGFLVSKYSCYKINLIVGFMLWTIASGLFTTVTISTSTGKLVAYQILTGLGSGQTLQTSLVAIQAAVQRQEMAVVTGARNYLRMMGSTLAIAASAAIVNNTVKAKLTALHFDPSVITTIIGNPTTIPTMSSSLISDTQKTEALDAYAHGVQVTYYMMTVLAGIQCLLCICFVKDYSLKRADDEQQKATAKNWLNEQKKKDGNIKEEAV